MSILLLFQVQVQTLAPAGIDSAERLGSETVSMSATLPGVEPGEVVGPETLTLGLSVSGVDNAEGLSAAVVFIPLAPSGITSEESLSRSSVSPTVAPSGIGSDESFSPLSLTFTGSFFGISTAEAMPQAFVAPVHTASGIGSDESLGRPALSLTLRPSGVGGEEALGTPSTTLTLTLTGLLSAEVLSPVKVFPVVRPSGISSEEALSAASLTFTGTWIGIGSSEVLGFAFATRVFSLPGVPSGEETSPTRLSTVLHPAGAPSEEALSPETLSFSATFTGLDSGEALPRALVGPVVRTAGVPSDEATSPVTGAFSGTATGITSAEEEGRPAVSLSSTIAGIGSNAELPTIIVSPVARPAGIVSNEAIGLPFVSHVGLILWGLSTEEGHDGTFHITVYTPPNISRQQPFTQVISACLMVDAPLGPNDLPLFVSVERGADGCEPIGPVAISYTLFMVKGESLHQVGAMGRTPATRKLGAYYATGFVGEGGQPGLWMVRWVVQEFFHSALTIRDFYFLVIDHVGNPHCRVPVPKNSTLSSWEPVTPNLAPEKPAMVECEDPPRPERPNRPSTWETYSWKGLPEPARQEHRPKPPEPPVRTHPSWADAPIQTKPPEPATPPKHHDPEPLKPTKPKSSWESGPVTSGTPHGHTMAHRRPLSFRWQQEFERGDLEIMLVDGQGEPRDPAHIWYTLHMVTPTGTLRRIGPARRTPTREDLGKFYVTGTAGEGGQPGPWVVRWAFQMTGTEPAVVRDERFEVVAAPTPWVKKGW